MEAKKFGQWLELLKIAFVHADGHGYMDNSELVSKSRTIQILIFCVHKFCH
jgi:hypothetical protein